MVLALVIELTVATLSIVTVLCAMVLGKATSMSTVCASMNFTILATQTELELS